MQCEKCGGSMMSRKLFRSSGCLAAAGVALLVVSLAATGLGVLVGLVGPRATRDAVSAQDTEAKRKAVASIGRIADVPRAVVEELEATGRVSEETLAAIPLEQR